ncbi:MAG: RluA family pseudouridine synthase [Kiritimatiellaeota bacterium]|nr:RluA family pseudouridine synthase [Kiritimatiellota bacterium]
MRRTASTVIRREDDGKTLLGFLAARFRYHSQEEWRARTAGGRIFLNDTPALPGAVLHHGDTLRYEMPDIPEPPVEMTYGVLFEDDALLAVNKPGNLPSHPGGKYFNHTLWAVLKARTQLDRLHFANRLDRETSGVTLLCKTPEAARHVGQQFAAHRVGKTYIVLVEGDFPEHLHAAGWLTADIASPVRKKRRFCASIPYPPPADAQPCETRFKRIRQCDGFCAVRAYPSTGHLHQIRATLHSLGHPVMGDKLYGKDETLFLRFISGTLTEADRIALRLARQALHAESLRLLHPVTNTPLTLSAPLPEDMRALFGQA